jgi:hypothetical protein
LVQYRECAVSLARTALSRRDAEKRASGAPGRPPHSSRAETPKGFPVRNIALGSLLVIRSAHYKTLVLEWCACILAQRCLARRGRFVELAEPGRRCHVQRSGSRARAVIRRWRARRHETGACATAHDSSSRHRKVRLWRVPGPVQQPSRLSYRATPRSLRRNHHPYRRNHRP